MQLYLHNCLHGGDGAVHTGMQAGRRCSSACLNGCRNLMEHCLPECRQGRDAAFSYDLLPRPRCSKHGRNTSQHPGEETVSRCRRAWWNAETVAMQHCLAC